MKEKILLIWKHLKQGTLKKMWKQTLWIYQYGKRYWKAMILYTLLGITGTGVSLVSSLISKDLVDIITGHQTGKLLSTFAAMISFSVANILVSQASGYASTFINLKVDSEIKNDIFAKMLVTDWESLTDYHTGDLVTRWSSDASNISSGILNWIPNLIIYTFRFISALAIVLYYDPTFALFALLGILIFPSFGFILTSYDLLFSIIIFALAIIIIFRHKTNLKRIKNHCESLVPFGLNLSKQKEK